MRARGAFAEVNAKVQRRHGESYGQRMPPFARLSIVDQAPREAVNQPVPRFRGFQQHRAAVGTRVGLIERRDKGFGEEVWEENSLWYRVVAQSKAYVAGKARLATALYYAEAFVSLAESAPS